MPRPKKPKPPPKPQPVPRILAICPHCHKDVPEPVLGPLAKYRTPSELEVAIDSIDEACKQADVPLTIADIALSLGFTDTDHLNTMLNRYNESKHPFAVVIKRAKERVKRHCERILIAGKPVNTAGIMFYGKNNFGWKDVKDIREERTAHYTIVVTQGDPAPRPVLTKGGGEPPDNKSGSMVDSQVADITVLPD